MLRWEATKSNPNVKYNHLLEKKGTGGDDEYATMIGA